MSKVITENIIHQFENLQNCLPKKMFIDNMKKQLPNYKLNMNFLRIFSDYLDDWVSYSDIDVDTIEYLLDKKLFNYDKWNENSIHKTKNIFTNEKFKSIYGDNIINFLSNAKNVSYNLVKEFANEHSPDEMIFNLLYNYNDDIPLTDYYLKYNYLIGRKVFRDKYIYENTIAGNDVFDKLFLSESPTDIMTFLEVIARGKIDIDKINNVFIKNNFALNKIDEAKIALYNKDNNSTYDDEDDDDINPVYKEAIEMINNIKDRYGLDIYFKFVQALFSFFPQMFNNEDLLYTILNNQAPESVLISIYNAFISVGMYRELSAYADNYKMDRLNALLLLNQE